MAQMPDKDSLLVRIKSAPEDSGKVRAYHILASLTVGTDAATAIAYAKKGLLLGKQLGYTSGIASCFLNLSYCYGLVGKLNEARLYSDSAIERFKQLNKPGPLSLCYQNRADYKMQSGRLKDALLDCDSAIIYIDQAKKGSSKANVFKTIAAIYYLQGNYQQSEIYCEKAYDLLLKIKDSITMTVILDKLGNIYEQQKHYLKSIKSFEKAIKISIAIKQENKLAEYYTSLSNVWLKNGDKKNAELSALKAAEYAGRKNNKLQLAAAQKMLSSIYLQKDSIADAINIGSQSFSLAASTESDEVKRTAAEALAEGYFKKGDYKTAYTYLQISKQLNDSLSKVKYDKELTTMQTSFKVNEKDKEILILNKDRELQRQQLNQQRFFMVGTTAIGVLMLLGIWLFINRNSLRQRMKELELRNQLAADLHDEVGSSLSSINMLSLMAAKQENEISRNDILTKMSINARETVDKMGDIVWMIKPDKADERSLKLRIERFAYDICSSKNIEVLVEADDLDKIKFSMEQRNNIYLIFKEALNNAVKYSDTRKIEIIARLQNKKFLLQIIDFGKGFNVNLVTKGNGLTNMQRRAKGLGALIDLSAGEGEGTMLTLTMPF
jgi:signal transduction histidine kinase